MTFIDELQGKINSAHYSGDGPTIAALNDLRECFLKHDAKQQAEVIKLRNAINGARALLQSSAAPFDTACVILGEAVQ